MVDITHKTSTLRIATAQAVVKVGGPETIERIKNGTVPKGDVLSMSKAAGLLGIKKTPEILPDCHPLPIEFTGIEYEIEETQIRVLMTVKTIYKTGVEVEAMHGASIVALNMYDMLKPIDKQVEITSIKLLSKTGGKSDFIKAAQGLKAQIIICSDSVAEGSKEDTSGAYLVEAMQGYGLQANSAVVPDEADAIKKQLAQATGDLIIFTGGTGVGPRDVTPDTIEPLLQTRLAGVEEELRRYGQERLKTAMLSRSIVGLYQQKLVLCIPGSKGAAKDAVHALFPHLFHTFHILKGGGH